MTRALGFTALSSAQFFIRGPNYSEVFEINSRCATSLTSVRECRAAKFLTFNEDGFKQHAFTQQASGGNKNGEQSRRHQGGGRPSRSARESCSALCNAV